MVGFWMLGKEGSLSYSELGRNMSDVWDFVSDCDKAEFESSAGATTVVGNVSDSIHQQWGISMPIALTDDDVVLDMGMGLPAAAGTSFSKKVGGASSSGGERSPALSLSHSHSQNLDLAPNNYNNNDDGYVDADVVKKVVTHTVVGSSRKRPSPASASASASAGGGGGGGTASGSRSTASPCDHDTHIWTERERRKKMRTMFSTLHSLLPHLAPKTDKSTIIDEAINYIKSLQKSVQLLQQQKLERVRPPAMDFRSFELQECAEAAVTAGPSSASSSSSALMESMGLECSLQTWSSPNVVISVCGEDAQIGICSVRRPGQLSAIFYTLEKHNIDVLTAHISGDSFRCMYMIHAHAQGSAEVAGEAYASVIGELVMYFSPTL